MWFFIICTMRFFHEDKNDLVSFPPEKYRSKGGRCFSPLHHLLYYLSISKEWHSLEPCLRQAWQDPQWVTDWMSPLRRETLTAFADREYTVCQDVKASLSGYCVHMCDFTCDFSTSQCVKAVLVMLFLCLCSTVCAHVTLHMFLHWHGALQFICEWILTAWCNVYLPSCISVCFSSTYMELLKVSVNEQCTEVLLISINWLMLH